MVCGRVLSSLQKRKCRGITVTCPGLRGGQGVCYQSLIPEVSAKGLYYPFSGVVGNCRLYGSEIRPHTRQQHWVGRQERETSALLKHGICDAVCTVCARAQSCLTLCNPMDPTEPTRLLCPCNSPGRNLEWAAIPFSRGSSWPGNWTRVSWNCRQSLYHLNHQGRPCSLLLTM